MDSLVIRPKTLARRLVAGRKPLELSYLPVTKRSKRPPNAGSIGVVIAGEDVSYEAFSAVVSTLSDVPREDEGTFVDGKA